MTQPNLIDNFTLSFFWDLEGDDSGSSKEGSSAASEPLLTINPEQISLPKPSDVDSIILENRMTHRRYFTAEDAVGNKVDFAFAFEAAPGRESDPGEEIVYDSESEMVYSSNDEGVEEIDDRPVVFYLSAVGMEEGETSQLMEGSMVEANFDVYLIGRDVHIECRWDAYSGDNVVLEKTGSLTVTPTSQENVGVTYVGCLQDWADSDM